MKKKEGMEHQLAPRIQLALRKWVLRVCSSSHAWDRLALLKEKHGH